MKIIDTYRHQGLRKQLLETLRQKQVCDERVLAAMMKVPRHIFLENAFLEHVYEDKAFPIGKGQTISHPSTVAYQTWVLDVQPKEVILEVGTGSGYQASILAEMGAYVLTIERQKELFDKTKKLLSALKYKTIQCFYGDGYRGLKNYAPFDKIIVTAAAPKIPEALVQQLKVGGRMVVPVGDSSGQTMYILDKTSASEVDVHEGKNFSFVPMLSGKNRG